ncbi:MAG: ABC transporter ATP-binding protein [Tissierellia bacterium]|nr:ABC transporter ATP-binding protein [Tissierellia bacterium]
MIIEIKDLTKKYGNNYALNNVSLNIERGDAFGLIGKNGAGKTTLIDTLMGLREKDSGEIKIFNQNSKKGLETARKKIGYSTEAAFYNDLSAYENLKYFATLKGASDQSIRQALKVVELENNRKPFKSFSLGMKKKLSLAVSLINDPEILILDEPTSGIDPQSIANIRNMLLEKSSKKTTMLISSHILSELYKVCNKFAFINDGKILDVIDKKTLKEKTSDILIIKTNDNPRAVVALDKLKYSNYKVNNDGEIVVYNAVSVEDISNELAKENITILELKRNERSLESYYLNLIGEKND